MFNILVLIEGKKIELFFTVIKNKTNKLLQHLGNFLFNKRA